MAQLIQAIRGMNDILPNETHLWQKAEAIFNDTLKAHAFHEIRFPIVEKTELFKRSIGEVTDIVEKEMYTFIDRNEESLTLRPEGTACCVRAGIEHGLLYNQVQRLWYSGPFFRHERPQKGRYRQFHQCSAEIFGLQGPDVDAELIIMSATLLKKLGLSDIVRLEINSIGTIASRSAYREKLIEYFSEHIDELDADSQNRLHKNTLRILDSKNPALKELIQSAPKLTEFLDEVSREHFETLQNHLSNAGVSFVINPCLVRGLDYYTHTVFEWVTDKLGAQSTVCAGGRYDTLVEQLGGKPTPAIGFSCGMERLILLMQQNATSLTPPTPHVYMMIEAEEYFANGIALANTLREKIPGLIVLMHTGGGLKNQLKKADKSGATYAVMVGEDTKAASIKHLREKQDQQVLAIDELVKCLGDCV